MSMRFASSMSMEGLMVVLWLASILVVVESGQEWSGVKESRQECGIQQTFFCPEGFICNPVGSGCIPTSKRSSQVHNPDGPNTRPFSYIKSAVIRPYTDYIATLIDNTNNAVTFANNTYNNKPNSLLNNNINMTVKLVNDVNELNSNSTNEMDQSESTEDPMGSLTVPSQGPVPVIIGFTVAGIAAVALAMYLNCGRRAPRGYQNI